MLSQLREIVEKVSVFDDASGTDILVKRLALSYVLSVVLFLVNEGNAAL